MTDGPPNIVVYISHDTGRFVGPHGVTTVATPALDRLGREGCRLDRAFCTAPQCSPSRAALFTGRYPHATGVLGLTGGWAGWALNDDEVHLAAHLGGLGYETMLVGIAHEASGWPVEPIEGRGFDDITYFRRHNARDAAACFAEWLEQGRQRPDRPFFAQIGTMETHKPYVRAGAEPDDRHGVTVPPYLHDGPGTREDFAALQGSVKRWDEGLQGVLAALDEHGLAENTIVIATTDHGLPVPRAKCTLYDAGLETLFLMRAPGRVPAGTAHEALFSNVDLVPTLLEAAGGTPPDDLHGVSFWPLVTGGSAEQPRDRVFGEKTYHTSYDPMRAVRTRRYKYIRNFEAITHEHCCRDCAGEPIHVENLRILSASRQKIAEFEELYDLERDPLEMENLAGHEAYEAVRHELAVSLARWMRDTGDPLLEGPVHAPTFWRNLEAFRAEAGV